MLFSQPELQEGDTFLRQARQKCEEAVNRLRVEPTTAVRTLAEQLFHDHAHLVIEPRNSKHRHLLCTASSGLPTTLRFRIPGVDQCNRRTETGLPHPLQMSTSDSPALSDVEWDGRESQSERWYFCERHRCVVT